MLTFNFDPFPTLTTDRLKLRRLVKEDAAAYFPIRSNPQVMKYIARPPSKTIADVLPVLERTDKMLAENTGICWAVTTRQAGKLIGTIGYYRTQFEHFRTEIGYDMDPAFWGNGYMSEAMQAVLDYIFFNTDVHSVEANIDPRNKKSARILERNNFIKEAHFRENYFFDGKFSDSGIFSLLKSRHLAMSGKSLS